MAVQARTISIDRAAWLEEGGWGMEAESPDESGRNPGDMADFTARHPSDTHALGRVAQQEREWFGHPRGLSTLFFTEMWERFSYYGMRALLVLFMTDLVADGGLGLNDVAATSIYGLYTFAVYAVALPGGWIADRLTGQRHAVLWGGIVIAIGHFTLAMPTLTGFYGGLILIVLGTGLLKPNVSAIVADLYPEGGAQRDAGFSIFYMGINLGALAGPLICGYLGERFDWHLGFRAAGVGMLLGVVQYALGWRDLGDAGILTTGADGRRQAWRTLVAGVGVTLGLLAVFVAAQSAGVAHALVSWRRAGHRADHHDHGSAVFCVRLHLREIGSRRETARGGHFALVPHSGSFLVWLRAGWLVDDSVPPTA